MIAHRCAHALSSLRTFMTSRGLSLAVLSQRRDSPRLISRRIQFKEATMDAPHAAPSSSDVASEAGSLMAGLGIITMALFPFAVPALALGLLVVLPLAPLALVALALWLLARILVLTLRFVRSLVPGRSGQRPAAEPTGETAPSGGRRVAALRSPPGTA
jgi:hypothetical protein